MPIVAEKVPLEKILTLRELFLEEAHHQIRYNARHERGWTDSYMLTVDGQQVGYGSVAGREISDRDTAFEFYVIPPFRGVTSGLFWQLLSAAHPKFIECQSNDLLMSAMLFEFARSISADVVLFEDHYFPCLSVPGVVVRPRREGDEIFKHQIEPAGEYVAEMNGEIVATGGFLLHYNRPYADLYMEVREDFRRRGIGSFLLQEVKRACYLAGCIPAARCNIENTGSRATLAKAGLRVSGFMLTGEVKD
jgi:GNAT superfamily N-acetyltransferase